MIPSSCAGHGNGTSLPGLKRSRWALHVEKIFLSDFPAANCAALSRPCRGLARAPGRRRKAFSVRVLRGDHHRYQYRIRRHDQFQRVPYLPRAGHPRFLRSQSRVWQRLRQAGLSSARRRGSAHPRSESHLLPRTATITASTRPTGGLQGGTFPVHERQACEQHDRRPQRSTGNECASFPAPAAIH